MASRATWTDQNITVVAAAQELAAEKERIAHEKEMETARLRAMQEKQADHQVRNRCTIQACAQCICE